MELLQMLKRKQVRKGFRSITVTILTVLLYVHIMNQLSFGHLNIFQQLLNIGLLLLSLVSIALDILIMLLINPSTEDPSKT